MPHIQQLPPQVAELIAAGEVVERPASVVKELVENAIDAGASAIVVELRRGGMGLIRVTDNGCGIAPAELPAAFSRHATSKLHTAEDLTRIATLGFRGEALAAIAAVSRLEAVTRRREDAVGAALSAEGGVFSPVEETGAPEGTTIRVSDLFFNTPARLKFMRRDSAEAAAAAGLLQHLALSRPDISFQFLRDGQQILHTPGDGQLRSAVYAALGREFSAGLTAAEGRGEETEVSGFVTLPVHARGSRGMQSFFVNGRFIKSQLLTAALEEAYRSQLMKGRFPGCILRLTLPPEAVDVNVHPAKTAVKFAREREVFDAVYRTVLRALEQGGIPAAPAPAVRPDLAQGQDFFRRMSADTFRLMQREEAPRRGGGKKPSPPPAAPGAAPGTAPGPQAIPGTAPGPQAIPGAASGAGTASCKPSGWNSELGVTAWVADRVSAPALPGLGIPAVPAAPPPPPPAGGQQAAPPRQEAAQETAQETALPQAAPWRIAGEVLNTYIICEDEAGDVWLIDKHAAHERMNFDRLMAAPPEAMRQRLLQPQAVEPGREDAALLLEHLPDLEALGFGIEDFGGGALLVREIPADIDPGEILPALEDLCIHLRRGSDPGSRREALLHTMACKAAIKGGWKSDVSELSVLVEKVQQGQVRYCPHGRPVAVKIGRYQLEKLFKRA